MSSSKKLSSLQIFQIYLKGFLKGVGIIIVYYLFLIIYLGIVLQLQEPSTRNVLQVIDARFYLLSWLYGLALVYYFVKRYKLLHSWIVLGLFISIYALPFMLGNAELQKTTYAN